MHEKKKHCFDIVLSLDLCLQSQRKISSTSRPFDDLCHLFDAENLCSNTSTSMTNPVFPILVKVIRVWLTHKPSVLQVRRTPCPPYDGLPWYSHAITRPLSSPLSVFFHKPSVNFIYQGVSTIWLYYAVLHARFSSVSSSSARTSRRQKLSQLQKPFIISIIIYEL
jgi:hypothetical protein